MQAKRTEHFFSANFSSSDAGELFPSSWTSQLQITRGGVQTETMRAHPEYLAEKVAVDEIKTKATLSFEKQTEDGTNFRIYRAGLLELRTTEGIDGEETVGAVFSVRA